MRIRKWIAALIVSMMLVAPLAAFQGQYKSEVAFVKTMLMAEGKDLSGACGAFQITGRVAFRLKDLGFKLLKKQGGNRAIILPDGSCVDSDHGSGVGYAVDYLISVNEGFVGYDLLGDGGGENGPQWIGPEDGTDIVTRNAQNMAEPFAMGGDIVVPPAPPPAPQPPPTPVPSPVPPVSPSDQTITLLIERIVALQEQQQKEHAEILAAVNNPGWLKKFVSNRYVQLVGAAVLTKYIPTLLKD